MAMLQHSPAFTIRMASCDDAAGILACLRGAFEDYRAFYTPAAFLDTVLTPETLQARLAEMSVFVAVHPASQMDHNPVAVLPSIDRSAVIPLIVGTIACHVVDDKEGHLRGMAVLPAWRGTGLASQLLSRAESELRARNRTRITLDTTEPLQHAMRFYEKHGYRSSGKISDFFGMPLFEYYKVLP